MNYGIRSTLTVTNAAGEQVFTGFRILANQAEADAWQKVVVDTCPYKGKIEVLHEPTLYKYAATLLYGTLDAEEPTEELRLYNTSNEASEDLAAYMQTLSDAWIRKEEGGFVHYIHYDEDTDMLYAVKLHLEAVTN